MIELKSKTPLYFDYVCDDELLYEKGIKETHLNKSYSEHAAMHYDCSGWSEWTTDEYVIEKCPKCGKTHRFEETKLNQQVHKYKTTQKV